MSSLFSLRLARLFIQGPVFAALRVYAIFHRKRWVFGVVLVTGLVNPVILFVSGMYSPGFHWLMIYIP